MTHWTIEMVLNRALITETQSYNLYTWAEGRVTNPGSKILLRELAQEELKHKEKIAEALDNRTFLPENDPPPAEVENLRITDYLKNTELSESATYQDILIYAGEREKETYEFYRSLADQYRATELGKLFSALAREELTHKNRIEKEYDRHVLQEM